MAFNGDSGPSMKRLRTDFDGSSHRNHTEDFGNYDNNPEPRRKRDEGEKVNHVLLFTILNPQYPITVDVLHTICSPSGSVQRIVIFKKNGVQAMVEFDKIDAAKHAKENLNGADIYSGCCTLKIDYAKPSKLNVYKNDQDSWDYSRPNLGKPENPTGRPGPLLKEPPQSFQSPHYRQGSGGGSTIGGGGIGETMRPSYNTDRYEDDYGPPNGPGPYPNHYGDRFPPERWSENERGNASRNFSGGSIGNSTPLLAKNGGGMRRGMSPPPQMGPPRGGGGGGGGYMSGGGTPPSGGGPAQGAVMMVYGLDPDKMNADKLFNLICLYGNVVRIKFLKTKEGCAMAQLGDGLSVERAMQNLNNSQLFSSKMQLGHSKQAFLSDVQQPYSLPDGSPSFKDYMGNKNNRFINPEMASKNRIQPPSKVLHFFNSPPGVTEEQLNGLFTEAKVNLPEIVKLFPSKTDRSSSGLLQFENISEALEALVMCNHTPIANPNGKFPYILKLCFSSFRHIPNNPLSTQQ